MTNISISNGILQKLSWPLFLAQHQEPRLGHLLNSVFKALPAEAAHLDSAVRHVVDPVSGYVVNNDPAYLKGLIGSEHPCHVVCEHPCLEAVKAPVHLFEGLLEIIIRFKGHYWRKDLLTADPHGRLCVGKDGRLHEAALASAAEERLRPV